MNLYHITIATFLFFLPLNAFADDNKEKIHAAECKAFYEENNKIIDDIGEKYEGVQEEEGVLTEEQKTDIATMFNHIFMIVDRGKECGAYEEGFYRAQVGICLMYMSDNTSKEFFDLAQRPFPYCDEGLARKDKTVLISFIHAYYKGDVFPKDYRKVLHYFDLLLESTPNDWLIPFLTTHIYRHGGHGVDKDEKKAFHIVHGLAKEKPSSQLPCELSLYYRDGIGTSKNEKEAQKWLSVYKKHYPDKECAYFNFDSFFRASFYEMKTKEIKTDAFQKP